MPLTDWSYKDIEDFYNRVRMALGKASEATVSDADIDVYEKAPFAEILIKSRVPKWQELEEEKFKIFESAIVYQTACFFQSIVTSKHISKKQIPTITIEYNDSIDFDIDGLDLGSLVDLLVSQLNGETGSNFIGFRVTKGGYVCERNKV